jgi:hypothetical protein
VSARFAPRARLDPISLVGAIATGDAFHAPTDASGPSPSAWKEWHHFCVCGEGVDVIVNFSLCEDTRPAAGPDSYVPRVITLVHDRVEGRWHGAIDQIPQRDASWYPGQVNLGFGHNTVLLSRDGFHLSLALRDQPVTAQMTLKPTARPLAVRNEVAVAEGKLGWFVCPRLEATGRVVAGDKVHNFRDALAYHDHNWGRWLWGHDFAWTWGYVLPDDRTVPWSLVFDRTTDRGRGQVLELTLAVWRQERLASLITREDVDVRFIGLMRPTAVKKFPPIAHVFAPNLTGDVPGRLEVTARSACEEINLCFEPESLCQIVIPNETDLGVTTINEVSGRASVAGTIRGEALAWEGRGVFEFLG